MLLIPHLVSTLSFDKYTQFLNPDLHAAPHISNSSRADPNGLNTQGFTRSLSELAMVLTLCSSLLGTGKALG